MLQVGHQADRQRGTGVYIVLTADQPEEALKYLPTNRAPRRTKAACVAS